MEWPKVKNIIILILLLINGFLLALVGVQQYQVHRYQQSALTQAVALLERDGITVNPDRLDSAPIPLTVERTPEGSAALSEALLGEGLTYEDQGGGLHQYVGAAGSATFRSGGVFTITLTDASAPDADLESHALSVLKDMGIRGEVRNIAQTGASTAITFYQMRDDVPIFSCPITLEYDGQRLLSVNGTLLLSSSAQTVEGASTLDLPTALIRFRAGILASGDVCSSLTAFRPGYRTVSSFGTSVMLSPVWYVSTNTADYQLDALTGVLTRIT